MIIFDLTFSYDPNVDLPSDIDTEQDRIFFIRSTAQLMVKMPLIKGLFVVIPATSKNYNIC